jgi:hypothetical protein
VPAVNFEGGMLMGLFGTVTTFEEIGKHPAIAMAFPSLAAVTLSFTKKLD